MGDELVERQSGNIVPLGRLRRELAEAQAERSIPRLQRVIGAATIAAEAQRKVARLAEGHGEPAEIVEAAREGARQAATVQIEAQAAAGRLLQEMSESGELQAHRGRRSNSPDNNELPLREVVGARSNSGAEHHANRWRKVAEVSDEVRAEYVEKATEEDKDITTDGLLRYARAQDGEEPKERPNLEVAYDQVVKAMNTITSYDPGIIFGHASNTRRRTKFREQLAKLERWVEQAGRGYSDD